jgi:hypothetical protein
MNKDNENYNEIVDKLFSRPRLMILVFTIVGLTFQYISSEIGYEQKLIHIVDPETANTADEAKRIKTISVIQQPTTAFVCAAISNLAIGLAGSMFISLFVIKKIEDSSAREREKELKQLSAEINVNVFETLFKTAIPEELYNSIKDSLIKGDVVRKSMQWDLNFKEITGDKIELTQILQYKLQNLRSETHNGALQFVHDAANGKTSLVKISATQNGKEILHRDVESGFTVGDVRDENKPDGSTIIEAKYSINGGGDIDVTAVLKTVYESLPINDANFMRYPVIDAVLNATFPKGFEFSVFEKMSSPFTNTFTSEDRAYYKAKGGILPGQGYVYTLKKKKQLAEK